VLPGQSWKKEFEVGNVLARGPDWAHIHANPDDKTVSTAPQQMTVSGKGLLFFIYCHRFAHQNILWRAP